MPRLIPCALLAALLGAVPLAAQEPSLRNATAIAVGDSVQGELTAQSPFYDEAEGIRYAVYRVRAAGRSLRATLRSVVFDSYLEVRKVTADSTELVGEDDDGGGNLDSQFSWDADGEYLLIVRHYGNGETGPFSLVVEEPPPPPVVVRGLAPGLAATGHFRAHDRQRADGRRLHEYELSLAAGEQVTLALQATDVDVALLVQRGGATVAEAAAARTASLAVTAPASGLYTVLVVGGADAAGRYTLSVQRAP